MLLASVENDQMQMLAGGVVGCLAPMDDTRSIRRIDTKDIASTSSAVMNMWSGEGVGFILRKLLRVAAG